MDKTTTLWQIENYRFILTLKNLQQHQSRCWIEWHDDIHSFCNNISAFIFSAPYISLSLSLSLSVYLSLLSQQVRLLYN